jgi:hypothetical protein
MLALMTLTEMVKGKTVRFKFYKDGDLWYETEDGFEFPVPIHDTGTGIFRAEDKAVGYMNGFASTSRNGHSGKRNGWHMLEMSLAIQNESW